MIILELQQLSAKSTHSKWIESLLALSKVNGANLGLVRKKAWMDEYQPDEDGTA